MFKQDTHKRIHEALCVIMAAEAPLWSRPANGEEAAETIQVLARRLADQLWQEGYELSVRCNDSIVTGVVPGAADQMESPHSITEFTLASGKQSEQGPQRGRPWH